jgi:hypothetical protein
VIEIKVQEQEEIWRSDSIAPLIPNLEAEQISVVKFKHRPF